MRIQQEEAHRLRGLRRAKEKDDFRQYVVEEGFQRVVGCGTFAGWTPPAGAQA